MLSGNLDEFLLRYDLFGFPVQMLRAMAALVVTIFVMRFMRSFEVETRRRIDELQEARLQEAERREALKGEMLRQVVAAQEAERQRIARELHDETGQSLTALGLGLRGVSSNLRQNVDKAAHNLRQLEGMAAQALDEFPSREVLIATVQYRVRIDAIRKRMNAPLRSLRRISEGIRRRWMGKNRSC